METQTHPAFSARLWAIGALDRRLSEADLTAERLLVTALADRETAFGMSVYPGETPVSDPRLCDTAAFMLNRRWPAKYAFHWSGSVAERDQEIGRIRAAWVVGHGAELLPP